MAQARHDLLLTAPCVVFPAKRDSIILESNEPGSADYIQLYHGDANLLKESLEVVQRLPPSILGAISPRMQ